METLPNNPKPRFWRSLEEHGEDLEPQAEFLPGAAEPPIPGLSRRNFLELLGASAALATAVACDRKGVPLVPYTGRPTEVVPGVSNLYASTFPEGARAWPVLVKTREGRPIHVSSHDTAGKPSLRALADILGLYDPDRIKGPSLDGKPVAWAQAEARLLQGARSGKPLLLLTGATASPSRRALVADLQRALPSMEHAVWEPAGFPGAWHPHLDRAKVLLSLGADFLNGDHPDFIAAFAKGRQPDAHAMNRLWVAEGPMTLTGSNADHRFLLRPSQAALFAFSLAKALHLPGADLSRVPDVPPGIETALWAALVKDLRAAGREALVLCGPAMTTETHEAVHLLNAALGSIGHTLTYEPSESVTPMATVLQKLAAGHYGAVLVWGTDPAYSLPGFKASLAQVPLRAWIGLRADETSAQCSLLLPEHHWLEAWGDHASTPGTLSLQQPTVGPLYDTRQGEELLLLLARSANTYPDYLKARWRREVYPQASPVPFERFFQGALHDGIVKVPTPSVSTPPPPAWKPALERALQMKITDFELVLAPDSRVHDGRYGNNGWLQELPEPVTKTTWGNPVSIAPEDAQKLGLAQGDLLRIEAGKAALEAPVYVQPGQTPGVLSLALGYGRAQGRVAAGIGVNAFALMDADGGLLRLGVKVRKLAGRREIPQTQRHHQLAGRDILRVQTLAEAAHPINENHELPTLYPPQVFPEQRWGMVVDLSLCVGCSSCVLACQSENNIAIVGPEQVSKGREMHWLRIDRYYEGDPANPRAAHQPMMCQQCDHAPCENVCPVNATNHSPDGLNQMVYNRCVGTRYCANNCPYKVRRFNFLEYTATQREPESLVHNPEVTVRPRGVMEKCTFCIQRIQDARVRAKLEKRSLKDGDITPACAAACPAGAIVFGNLKDPQSRVSRLAQGPRGYKVLEELGVRPAVTYLAAVRNPADGGKS